MLEQIKEESPIERAKKRIVKLQELETKLMDASAVRADSIFIRQSAIYENYYADVSDLLDELEKADKEISKYHKLHDEGYNANRALQDQRDELQKRVEEQELQLSIFKQAADYAEMKEMDARRQLKEVTTRAARMQEEIEEHTPLRFIIDANGNLTSIEDTP